MAVEQGHSSVRVFVHHDLGLDIAMPVPVLGDLQNVVPGPSLVESWLGESGQIDKWIFCLTAAMVAANQESK